jgi:hypothetical protein
VDYRLGVAGLAAVASLTACGSGTPAPAGPPASDRVWVDNAQRFVATLDSGVGLTAPGGPSLADARRAMADSDGVYSLLVAYDLFGDCGHELAAVGVPSPRAGRVVATLISACTRLERASGLFQQAMTRTEPKALLAATRVALGAVPFLARARLELAALAS